MKNVRMKILLLGVLFTIASGLKAQDKHKEYEYATITQYGNMEIDISVAGKPFEIQKLSKDNKSAYDHTELLGYIDRMQKDGWDVFNSQIVSYANTSITMTFVMRREK